jgi:hypothetical protein
MSHLPPIKIRDSKLLDGAWSPTMIPSFLVRFSAYRWRRSDSLEGGKGLEVSPRERDTSDFRG